eukprot:TRINITY_DN65666_c0_g1_i1.p1 TRINITY_DN65666_c0_g1~~TRINITY_DN65666_c0_g1_i1.p1  ORF type:complete len:391 (-),score=25.95 TRINITY_DN65666_c0_g1_i1:182-1354(-)
MLTCCWSSRVSLPVPHGIVEGAMKDFQNSFNLNDTAKCAAYYAQPCKVIINSPTHVFEKTGTISTPVAVESFLRSLRNKHGGSNLRIAITRTVGNMHEDSWTFDSGIGASRVTWERAPDGEWQIVFHELTFSRIEVPETVPAWVVDDVAGDFEEHYNQGDMAKAVSFGHADACKYVWYYDRLEHGRSFSASTRAEAAAVCSKLRDERGITNLQLKIMNIEGNESFLTWQSDGGLLNCRATWQKSENDDWRIISSVSDIVRVLAVDAVPKEVVHDCIAELEENFNANDMTEACSIFANACHVHVNFGRECICNTPAEAATFFASLRNEKGGTNMRFDVTRVEGKEHDDQCVCDAWAGSGRGIWGEDGDGDWSLIHYTLNLSPRPDEHIPSE